MTGPFQKFGDRRLAARIVPLTERDVEDATRLLTLLKASTDADFLGPAKGGDGAAASQTLLDAACRALSDRRRRRKFFPEAMFGEPAWEILLLLYTERQGKRFSIGRLADELGLPQSSTGRWVNYLQDRKFAQRTAHPTDQRTVYVEITERGVKAFESYFCATPSLSR